MIMTAHDAIARSIANNEIVHITAVGCVQIDLLAIADDSVDTIDADGDMVIECWGATGAGDDWTVHLHGASAY